MIFGLKYAEYKALDYYSQSGPVWSPGSWMTWRTSPWRWARTPPSSVWSVRFTWVTALSGTFSNILMTAGLPSGLGPGKQQSHPGNWHPRHHTQWKDLRLSRRVQEEVDASHRQGPAGGCRAVHVPAQHGADEVHHWGPQRHHQARHRGRDGAPGSLRGWEREVSRQG